MSRKTFVGAVSVGSAVIAVAVLSIVAAPRIYRRMHQPFVKTEAVESPFRITGTSAPPPANQSRFRPVYGHSLVAGGIRSIAELVSLVDSDPQLARHYHGFDLSKARFIALDHDVVAYVSYRLGQGIYWKATPSIILQGEQVITDGENFIRARCGNRIAYSAGPTGDADPLDTESVVAVLDPATPVAPNSPESLISSSSGFSLVPEAADPGSPSGAGITPTGAFLPTFAFLSPPAAVSADEFSSVPLTILNRSLHVPVEVLTLFAGIFCIVAFRLLFGR